MGLPRVSISEKSIYICLLLLIEGSLIASSISLQRAQILSYGEISYPIIVDVSVDFSEVIAINNLSLGVQIEYEWLKLVKYPELQNKFAQSKFRIVRFFLHSLQPCLNWNETTRNGIYDWSKFDQLMQTLQNIGVENVLMSVGHNSVDGLPPGMERNYNNTGFPNPESFATYCTDIAVHVKNESWNIKYWEPYNEPDQVFDNDTAYMAFVDLFNTASNAVLQVFPETLFGVDISNMKSFLDRFVNDGRNVGFLSFHKYDAWGTWLWRPNGYLSDDEVLRKASVFGDNDRYTPQEMRDKWRSIKGVELPVFCTETNLNSAWRNGTDPRIQEVIGAIWYAEELRAFIMNGVESSVYFHFASDDSPRWEIDKQTKGYGFGALNKTPPHTEWYPYLTNYLFGNNLNVGDNLYNCSSSNPGVVSTLAWRSNGYYNILLIGKAKSEIEVALNVENLNIGNETVLILKINEKSSGLQWSEEEFTRNFNILENGYFLLLLKLK